MIRLYIQRVWSILIRLYVGWTHQLTPSNKHIRFAYFESGVVPLTVLNWGIFITAFVILPWLSFYCWYFRQHTSLVRSLHSFIVFGFFPDWGHRDCAQRRSEFFATTITMFPQFNLSSIPEKPLRYIIGKIPSETHIQLRSNPTTK